MIDDHDDGQLSINHNERVSRNQNQWIYTDEPRNQKHRNNVGNSTINCSKTDAAKKKENRELVAVLEGLTPAMVLEVQALMTVLKV